MKFLPSRPSSSSSCPSSRGRRPLGAWLVAAVLGAFVALNGPSVGVFVDAQTYGQTAADDADSGSTATDACAGICGGNGDSDGGTANTNPDATVTYNWTPRVPVGSSEVSTTEQTLTCAEFGSLLVGGFGGDPSACAEHQAGIQEAGCLCGDDPASSSSPIAASATASAAVTVVAAGGILFVALVL